MISDGASDMRSHDRGPRYGIHEGREKSEIPNRKSPRMKWTRRGRSRRTEGIPLLRIPERSEGRSGCLPEWVSAAVGDKLNDTANTLEESNGMRASKRSFN